MSGQGEANALIEVTNRERCNDCWETQTKLILEKQATWVGLSRFERCVNQKSSLKIKIRILKQDERGIYISKGKMHCISFNFTSITYLFCRYSKKQNSHWDPTRLTRIEVLLNHIKDGNSTKAKFINEDKKDGFLFMEKGFTSTNAKQCEDDQGYFHLDG
jgi:hypothetical protein